MCLDVISVITIFFLDRGPRTPALQELLRGWVDVRAGARSPAVSIAHHVLATAPRPSLRNCIIRSGISDFGRVGTGRITKSSRRGGRRFRQWAPEDGARQRTLVRAHGLLLMQLGLSDAAAGEGCAWGRAEPTSQPGRRGLCSECRRRANQTCRRKPYLVLTGAMRTPTPDHHFFRHIRSVLPILKRH
jgi:hypothetical protein